jgi:hypothetical protein
VNVDPNDKRKKGPNFGAGKKVQAPWTVHITTTNW